MFVARFLSVVFLLSFTSDAARLPDDEVEALREVGKRLGKMDWNFMADPCGGLSTGWISTSFDTSFVNNVTCNCTFQDNTACHVTNMVLRAQSLPGTLPPQIVRLPFLQQLDLARNYLSGPIPPEWGSTKLVKLNVLGNRLTGPIPKEIGNISTLVELNLEINHFSGSLPPELGNLTNLSRLLLTSNNFSGELPPSLARISSLTDFRISDNHFTGPIPKFIQSWTNLGNVAIQGSGLSGPIPSEIGLLTNLTDVRISDLNGGSSPFPPLNTLTKLETLILRSCYITGVLPDNLDGLTNVRTLFLSGNLLNGSVPLWMIHDGENIDLSYNKFTQRNVHNTGCESRSLNLFASSSQDHNSLVLSPYQLRWEGRIN